MARGGISRRMAGFKQALTPEDELAQARQALEASRSNRDFAKRLVRKRSRSTRPAKVRKKAQIVGRRRSKAARQMRKRQRRLARR